MEKILRATSSKIFSSIFSKRSLENSRAFTLIEVLIVISLVALMATVGIPALNNAFRTSTDSFTRRLAVSLREARDRAMLTDKLVRLRIDMEKQEFWFEEAPSSYLLPKATDKNLTEREREEKEKKEKDAFRMAKELAPEKTALPHGLKITEVISPRAKQPLREGIIDVYFFANGNTDGVKIRFESEEKTRQQISLHPITGQSKFELGYEDVP